MAQQAFASNITFSVIAPHEYELPVDYTPFFIAIQYGQQDSAQRAFNGSGSNVAGSKTNTFVGLTKLVYLFKVPALPNLGFAVESITPELSVSHDQAVRDVRGIGDNIFGLLIWYKPLANVTLGVQDYLSGPTASSYLSNHDWTNNVGVFLDAQFSHLSFSGDIGVVTQSTQYGPGIAAVTPGSTVFANARFGLKNETMFEPFVGADWQTAGASYVVNTGLESAPHGEETAVDVGVQAKFTPKINLSVFYNHAVQGRNVDATNAGYFKLVVVY
ncbi:transporter [Beijerinckia sp. L45]|uniref:transporter n=1 Tax=Beijerinckia sp. L45 TaxID=1641855 RepID=UPI00131D054F|nr:transporter [Beijerinckia sp. L45]